MFKFLFGEKQEIKAPEDPLKSQRFNDGILIVAQNSDKRALTIEAANMNALNALGYGQNEMVEHDLRNFLTDRVADEINDFVRFDNNAENLDEVLKKIRRFKMRSKLGRVLPMRLRVVRALSTTDHPRFQLVLNDDSLHESIESNREKYRVNLRGNEVFDKDTGLLSKESAIKDLELVTFYSDKSDLRSTLVLVTITNFEAIKRKYEDIQIAKIKKDFAQKLLFNNREEDITSYLEKGDFLVILTETPDDNINVPLRRLKMLLTSSKFEVEHQGKNELLEIDFKITHAPVRHGEKPEDQIYNLVQGEGKEV